MAKRIDVSWLTAYYGSHKAIEDISMTVEPRSVTAFIGPSGCGKTTVLRCFNRMNDLIPTAKIEGTLTYQCVDLYHPTVSAVEVRRRMAAGSAEALRRLKLVLEPATPPPAPDELAQASSTNLSPR